jgi:AcrR family transcriptional regulator
MAWGMQQSRKPRKRSHGGRPSLEEAELLFGRILDAAAELFTKNGYGGTSIEAIAAHAGIGKLTLYRRFADKDALFAAVVVRMAERSGAAMQKIAEKEGSVAEMLTTAGRHLLEIVLSPESIAFHRILFAEAARLPELCARVAQDKPTEFSDALYRMFLRLSERGEIQGEDVVFLDQQFLHAIIGRPLRKALFGAPPMNARAREEHVRKAVALFLNGMAKRDR